MTSPLISKEPTGKHSARHHTVWAARNTPQESQEALGFLPWVPALAFSSGLPDAHTWASHGAVLNVDAIDPDEVRLILLDLLLAGDSQCSLALEGEERGELGGPTCLPQHLSLRR